MTPSSSLRHFRTSGLALALTALFALLVPSLAQADPRPTSRNTGSPYQGPDVTVPDNTTLPERFSLRPWMSRVQDQERRGTCVAFVLTAYLEFLYQRNLSEQYTYYVAEVADGNDTQGLAGVKAVQTICEKGTVDESLWEYSGEKIPEGGRIDGGPVPDTISDRTRRYRFSKFRFIAGANVEAMRYAVAVLHRPLVVSVPIDWDCGWRDGDINMPRASFGNGNGDADEADLDNQVQGVAHAVMIVGYLHDQKRFIIRNSWGEDTAYAGYYTIPYAYVTGHTRYIYICDAENAAVRVDPARGRSDDHRYVELSRFSAGNGRYEFREDLVVGPKQSLNVPPGSTLVFKAGTGVDCFGTIECAGTAEKPIRFTGDGWHGVRIGTRRGSASLAHCVIEGGVDSGDNGGCLRVTGGAKLVASHCVIRGGKATKGGGIYSVGGVSKETHEYYGSHVTLTHCQVSACVASDSGGALHFNAGSGLTATDTVFADNTGRAGGAAILIGGDSGVVAGAFTRCTFRGNQANGDGGAVNVNKQAAGTFDSCVFEGNTAGDQGGALTTIGTREHPATLTISGASRFVGNRSGNSGGAVYVNKSVKATIDGARFEANAAGDDAGAVSIQATDDERSELKITRCDFANNTSDANGGHARVGRHAWMTLENCSFDGGSAKKNSGAVHVNGGEGHPAILRASDCTFRNTQAVSGGAVNVNWYGQAEFTRCRFERTSSQQGGAAIWSVGRADAACPLVLTDCVFSQTRAGGTGCINVGKATELRMENCQFESCVAEGAAGAISFLGEADAAITARIHRCTFSECNGGQSGGAVSISACATAMFTNCGFSSNRSSGNGGAVYIAGTGVDRLAKGIFKDCTFDANSATQSGKSGGALCANVFTSAQFDRCEFTRNTSANAGGGMFLAGHSTKATEVVFNDCRIASNRAGQAAGGVLINRRVSVRYSRCTIERNRSGRADGNGIMGLAERSSPALVILDGTSLPDDDVVAGEHVELRR